MLPDHVPALVANPGELTTIQADAIRQTFKSATSENTSRAYRADLEAVATWNGKPLAFPLSPARVLAYLADHKASLSVATLSRRVASLSTAHRLAGIEAELNPCRSSQVRAFLSALRREAAKSGRGQRRASAMTLDLLDKVLAVCGDGLRGKRDAALLSLAFASGGRRRSEVAALNLGDVAAVETGYLVTIRTSKTDQQGKGMVVPVRGRAAQFLSAWISALAEHGIHKGRLFRGLNRHGQLTATMNGQSIDRMVKARAAQAGLPGEWSAHSLRAGYVTSAALAGVSLPEAMSLSGHRSVNVAAGYFRAGQVMVGKAGMLMGGL